MKDMERLYRDYVRFTGTGRTFERTIYMIDGKYFCKWYGNFVEIEKGRFGWRTVELY